MPAVRTGPRLRFAIGLASLLLVGLSPAAALAPQDIQKDELVDEPQDLAEEMPVLAPNELAERAKDALEQTANDPGATVRDPEVVVDPLLGGTGPEPAPEPEPGRDEPGFAAGIREAFGERAMAASVASLLLVGAGLAGFALVTRYISPKEALRNPQRAMLYGYVRGHPGVHLKQLGDEFAMKTSSILWHVRKLESAQLVRSERANGFRVFYPVEGGIEVRRVSRALAALQNRNARAIFGAVERRPGAMALDLAASLSIHGGTVRWHLRKLREYGLVEELVRDDGSAFFATLLGRKALQALEGVPAGADPEGPLPGPAAGHPAGPHPTVGSLDRNRMSPVRAE